jgi:hypothetical protein
MEAGHVRSRAAGGATGGVGVDGAVGDDEPPQLAAATKPNARGTIRKERLARGRCTAGRPTNGRA